MALIGVALRLANSAIYGVLLLAERSLVRSPLSLDLIET
jgi:hypothetical protein